MFISDETIRIIHLVARHQNITTAAEQLNKVPSTISYTLKKAEETLGVELFIRKGRYIELSPAGSYFIEHSKNILRDLDALKRNTVLIHDGIERELTIAVNNIIPGDLLVAFIRDFERQFTSTTLTVDLEVYNGCWDALYSKRADLVYGAPHAVPSSEGIISEPVGQMEWDFVVSPLHPLAAKRFLFLKIHIIPGIHSKMASGVGSHYCAAIYNDSLILIIPDANSAPPAPCSPVPRGFLASRAFSGHSPG